MVWGHTRSIECSVMAAQSGRHWLVPGGPALGIFDDHDNEFRKGPPAGKSRTMKSGSGDPCPT
jgi:hypothetical protein